ncbi:MAG TPA: cupredoxin domain-containing protein [Micropepsaceae bacterium]|nr:cupredoxin domain-containing protein [Micropepsaceae bacterium]
MSRKAIVLTLVVFATVAQAQPAANGVDWTKAQVIEITMSNFDFAPKTLQLKRNTPYRLHFVNNGSSDHNFASKELFAAVMAAPSDRAKIENGEVEVEKGKSEDVSVMPMTAGSFPFHCTHFLHSMFGMHGQAMVGE